MNFNADNPIIRPIANDFIATKFDITAVLIVSKINNP